MIRRARAPLECTDGHTELEKLRLERDPLRAQLSGAHDRLEAMRAQGARKADAHRQRRRVLSSAAHDLCDLVSRDFTHFIDLTADAPGKRVRPVAELPEGLAYLGSTSPHTGILVYAARGGNHR